MTLWGMTTRLRRFAACSQARQRVPRALRLTLQILVTGELLRGEYRCTTCCETPDVGLVRKDRPTLGLQPSARSALHRRPNNRCDVRQSRPRKSQEGT